MTQANPARTDAGPPLGTVTGPSRAAVAPSRRLTVLAAAAGALSALAALLFVVAPVDQRLATYSWDLDRGVSTAAVPLSSYRPVSLTVTVGCTQAAVPGTVFSTEVVEPTRSVPSPNGLWIGSVDGRLEVVLRGEPLLARPVADLPCDIRLVTDHTRTVVTAGSQVLAERDGDHRPEVAAFASALPADVPTAGLSASLVADTRFESSPTPTKLAAGSAAVLLLATGLAATAAADRRSRTHRPRWWPRHPPVSRRWDALVVGGLILWALVGPLTVDDGYTTTMVADSARSGFVGGYHHWLNSPEAPFGSFYQLFAWWTGVSTELGWLRVPAVVLGIGSWLLLSRLVLPRLLVGMRTTAWVSPLAAVLFLAAWLPYDNGLRSEPYLVVGTLLTWCLVERGVATRRVLPVAAATIAAASTVTVAPTGLIAPVVLLAAVGPLWRVVRARPDLALLPVLALLAGCASIALLPMFADQTWAAVTAGTEVRAAIGPNLPWYEESRRYDWLLRTPEVEGSLGRRVPVLLMFVGLVAIPLLALCRVPLARVRRGPACRFVLSTILGLAAFALAPTKWTHHFGALAACATVVVVLTAWVGAHTLRATWQRALLLGAIALAAAESLRGAVTWWFPSGEGIAWGTDPPGIGGVPLSTVAVVVALGCGLVALAAAGSSSWAAALGRVLPSTALALVVFVTGGLAIQTFGLVRAVAKAPGYTVGGDVLAGLGGRRCGIAPAIQVEPDPAAGLLAAAPAATGSATVTGGIQAGPDPDAPTDPSVPPSADRWQAVGGRAGRLVTGWYPLPPTRDRRAPVVVTAGGRGPATVVVEFGRRSAADGFTATTAVAVSLTDRVADRRVPVPPSPGVDAVRVRAELGPGPTGSWLVVTAPRVPRLVALAAMFPADGPALLDWPVAPLMPCQRLASLAGGVAELPTFVFTSRPDPEAMARSAGGPFAMIANVADLRPVPTYLDGAPALWSPQILAVVPRVELRAPRVDVGWAQVSGSGRTTRLG